MDIVTGGIVFRVEDSNLRQVHVFAIPEDNDADILWECELEALWRDQSVRETEDLKRVWALHNEGDYFQQTLIRHNLKRDPHVSYTAMFHDTVRAHHQDVPFILNIFSTSTLSWLSLGYQIYPGAIRFWKRQVEKGVARYIESEQRYVANYGAIQPPTPPETSKNSERGPSSK